MTKTEILITHHSRTLHGYFYEPEGRERYPLVIMSHGYNGHKSDFEITAQYFAAAGIASVACTFCGGSTRDESGFPTIDMTLFTEKEDLLAMLDFMKQKEKVDQKKIFLFGASQGGLISAMVGEDRRDELAGMILLFPALGIADNWRVRFEKEEDIPQEQEFWGMKLGKGFFTSMREFHLFDTIGGFQKPVLIMHGTDDPVVSIETSRRAAAIYSDVRLEEFAGEPHGFSENGNRRMEAMMLYFIHRCLERGSI